MLKIIILCVFAYQNVWSDSINEVPDNAGLDSLIPADRATLKSQLDSASSLLKKIGKAIEKGVNSFADKKSGHDGMSKEALENEIRRKFYKLTEKFDPIPIIKAPNLLEIFKDTSTVMVDVRKTEEIEVSRIPGAYSPIEFSKKFTNPDMLEGKVIIVYCTIGYRSCEYGQKLKKMNLNVKNLEGGLLAWTHIGGPLIKIDSSGRVSDTRDLHTYSEEWDLTAPGYNGLW